MNRRDFVKSAIAAPLACSAEALAQANGASSGAAGGSSHPLAGKPLPPWKPGEFQVHFIYTGVAESMFWIMPDGTTMLLDCGDHPAWTRGKLAVWVLPDGNRYAGEWIARYVARVNPNKADVDYMMLSHHHSDHGGMEGWGAGRPVDWKGQKISRSGFMLAAETLKFRRGFDRGWPNFDDPVPDEQGDTVCLNHIRNTIAFLQERDGLEMERFEVGAVNQVAMRRNAAGHPAFKVTNICGNGKILCRDGRVKDLFGWLRGYKGWINENCMSLGLMAQYGPFRFYTAGDFAEQMKKPDGTRLWMEDCIAPELDPVDVAKMGHHGCYSMGKPIVAALRARVWTACIWDKIHLPEVTLERLADRSLYPGPRLIAPGVFTPLKRFEMAGRPFLADIAPESFGAGHMVLNVAPGGRTYSIAYVTADDESMKVTGAYDFVSKGEGRSA
ncbi:MAG: MBL fold metallo-hydrolase [Kiritimatiellae bacterium]|nr:MBL fold metallo-hydrolase [Kiritimatiellia bacterium]